MNLYRSEIGRRTLVVELGFSLLERVLFWGAVKKKSNSQALVLMKASVPRKKKTVTDRVYGGRTRYGEGKDVQPVFCYYGQA